MPAKALVAPNVHSVANVRDLGGYDTPHGSGHTLAHRFVRCGATSSATSGDLDEFRRWGVRHVLDLRSVGESPRVTCRFAREPWVRWENASLYDVDISAPAMAPKHEVRGYLASSYFRMLATYGAIRQVFAVCGTAQGDECVLFHCAAGMDRTGMVGMLLLGLADVPREQIIADYLYSFGPRNVVDAAVGRFCADGTTPSRESGGGRLLSFLLRTRLEAISTVYDTLLETHGSVRNYLRSCDVPESHIDGAFAHLVEA